jgi:flagellin
VPDVLASADSSGRLILSSTTGASIAVRDGSNNLVTSVASSSGDASVGAINSTGGAKVSGRITLTSSTGADIRVESKITGSAAKAGLADQGGSDTLVGGALTVTTQESAGRAITAIDSALDQVAMSRADLGAFQNRLTAAVDNLSSQSTNLAEAKGRIMDTDYAKATTELARAQIVQQAATAMLAQANQQPQMVLSLLQ